MEVGIFIQHKQNMVPVQNKLNKTLLAVILFIFCLSVSYCSSVRFDEDKLVNRALQKRRMFESASNN